MLKVLFVSSGNSFFGISPIIKRQGEGLKSSGIDLDYFAIKGKGFLNYLKNIFKLKKYLNENKYEIVHSHYGLAGLISLIVNRGAKNVISFMGDDLLGSINKNKKYSTIGKLFILINKMTASYYDYIIVKSNSMRNILSNIEKIEVIPNGVDLKTFYPVDKIKSRVLLNYSINKNIVIFVSNPNRKEKNYELLENSINLLIKENIEIKIVEKVEQDKLKYFYSAADCLVLSSIHEGSPNVIKEAMACCCPIVSTDVGDVKYIIGDSEGCFISSNDPTELSLNIRKAISFSKKYGITNGRRRLIDLKLDSVSISDRISNVYKKVNNTLCAESAE